jgi:hypothetical protein
MSTQRGWRTEVFASPGGEPHGKRVDDWTPVRQTVSTLPRVARGLRLDHVRKSYVTSAGHATHYVMFCRVEGGRTAGPPELLIFKHDSARCCFQSPCRTRGHHSLPRRSARGEIVHACMAARGVL